MEVPFEPEGWRALKHGVDGQLEAETVYFYFRPRGSGNLRCSTCFCLVWHADIPAHVYWHLRQTGTWNRNDDLDPEDMQVLVVAQYCNGQFSVDPHVRRTADFLKNGGRYEPQS